MSAKCIACNRNHRTIHNFFYISIIPLFLCLKKSTSLSGGLLSDWHFGIDTYQISTSQIVKIHFAFAPPVATYIECVPAGVFVDFYLVMT
jgi:hypothetical protein